MLKFRNKTLKPSCRPSWCPPVLQATRKFPYRSQRMGLQAPGPDLAQKTLVTGSGPCPKGRRVQNCLLLAMETGKCNRKSLCFRLSVFSDFCIFVFWGLPIGKTDFDRPQGLCLLNSVFPMLSGFPFLLVSAPSSSQCIHMARAKALAKALAKGLMRPLRAL